MTSEVDITSELLPRHVAVLDTIAQLGLKYGPDRWVIVGGMMVMILGREYQARAPRAEGTKDADILVDIVTSPGLLGDVAHFLESMGYELQDGPGDETKTARCTFVYHSARIDVLCPDDTPAGQLIVPDRNVASIAIPGGRRAFETARPIIHVAATRRGPTPSSASYVRVPGRVVGEPPQWPRVRGRADGVRRNCVRPPDYAGRASSTPPWRICGTEVCGDGRSERGGW